MSQNFNQTGKLPHQSPVMGGGGATTSTSGKAIASLILGLVSIVAMCFTAVPGLILGIMGLSDINRSQGRVGGKGVAVFGIVLSSIGLVWTVFGVLLLTSILPIVLPAVQVVRQAARETTSTNNIKQQVLAILNYESEHGAIPQQDKSGLSWRVHILPFIGEQYLYNQFILDEPWDSPNNIQLIDQMPDCYDCPTVELEPGLTVYQVPYTDMETNLDPKDIAVFDTSGVERTLGKITDGASNTVMVLEVNPEVAVEWTKPVDWEFDPADSTRGLGALNSRTIIVGFADGRVERLPNSIDPKVMKAIITRAGGEKIPRDFGN